MSTMHKLHKVKVDGKNIFLIKIKEELREKYHGILQRHNAALGRALSDVIGVPLPSKRDRELHLPRRGQGYRNKHSSSNRRAKRDAKRNDS